MTHDSSTTTHDDDDRPSSGRPTRRTMRSVSQTNPYTGKNFGATMTFHRGTTVVADGGAADGAVTNGAAEGDEATDDDESADDAEAADDEEATHDDDRPRMRDVDKTPPAGAPDPNAVYMRGGERPAVEEEAEE